MVSLPATDKTTAKTSLHLLAHTCLERRTRRVNNVTDSRMKTLQIGGLHRVILNKQKPYQYFQHNGRLPQWGLHTMVTIDLQELS